MDLINELTKYGITERGNTLLIEYETSSTAFYAEIEEGKWLEFIVSPENSPAAFCAIQNKSLSEIRTHIEENFGNHYFLKNNIAANASGNQPVDLAYVMERVRDHLYVYRDNTAFETKDTVTTIHNFLEKKEWTLDIADIETLRQESDEA